jgi:hypothetical protein
MRRAGRKSPLRRASGAAPADAPNFRGPRHLGRIESERRLADDEAKTFTHFAALSKPMPPKQMAQAMARSPTCEEPEDWPRHCGSSPGPSS